MNEAALLELLPEDLKITNCAYCGRVTCREKDRTLEVERLGVRAMGAFRRGRDGHRRPYCVSCFLDLPPTKHGQLDHRVPGQAYTLDRLWRDRGKR